MYLESVHKDHAVDGMSLSHNAAISCIIFWVNDYRFLCNLSCGKSTGWNPTGTNMYYRLNGLCIKIFLAEDMPQLGSYDLIVSVCIVIYMAFDVIVNCSPHTLVVQRGLYRDVNDGLYIRSIPIYYIMSWILYVLRTSKEVI